MVQSPYRLLNKGNDNNGEDTPLKGEHAATVGKDLHSIPASEDQGGNQNNVERLRQH